MRDAAPGGGGGAAGADDGGADAGGYWSPPAGLRTLLVDAESIEKLRKEVEEALDTAHVAALDAEWPPCSGGGGRCAPAALAQVALVGAGGRACVVVLDLDSLPVGETKPLLQRLLRRPGCLKLGWGLRGDILAVGAALGEGGGAVAVVAPAVDLGGLHRRLAAARVPGVEPPPEGGGLAAAVHQVLGAPLDKRAQCSAWGARPLSAAQLAYAAADAACLLALLDSFIGRRAAAAAAAAADAPLQEQDGGEDRDAAWAALGRSRAGAGAGGGGLFGGLTARAAALAAAEWGTRLEPLGAAPGRRRGAGGAAAAAAERARAERLLRLRAFPARLPWAKGDEPRFLTDVMLSGLKRQLVMWGFDCAAQEPAPKGRRAATLRALVERAAAERRVILTADAAFVARGLSDAACLVRPGGPGGGGAGDRWQQLAEVARLFSLDLAARRGALLTRCARCGGGILPEPVAAAELARAAPAHAVDRGVLEARAEGYWVCENAAGGACGGVFWQGAGYARAMRRLEGEVQRLRLGGRADGGGGAGGGGAVEAAAAAAT